MDFTFRSPHAGAVPYLTSVTYSRPSLSTCLRAKMRAEWGGATSEIPPESRDKRGTRRTPFSSTSRFRATRKGGLAYLDDHSRSLAVQRPVIVKRKRSHRPSMVSDHWTPVESSAGVWVARAKERPIRDSIKRDLHPGDCC
jgi:hypothetical protein